MAVGGGAVGWGWGPEGQGGLWGGHWEDSGALVTARLALLCRWMWALPGSDVRSAAQQLFDLGQVRRQKCEWIAPGPLEGLNDEMRCPALCLVHLLVTDAGSLLFYNLRVQKTEIWVDLLPLGGSWNH